MDAKSFFEKAANLGGRIVNTGDLTTFQISEAREHDCLFVTDDGMGWAILPWDLTTAKDRQRERRFFNAAPAPAPSGDQE